MIVRKRASTAVEPEPEEDEELADNEDELVVSPSPKRKRKASNSFATPAKKANNKVYSSAERMDNGIGHNYSSSVSSAR